MSDRVPRRKLIIGGLAAAAGLGGLGVAARVASSFGLIPPDSGGVWGPGETLTYAAQRILMSRHSLAREFNRSEVSKVIPISGPVPKTEPYERLKAGNFADWRLTVDGMVARPANFSLAELKRMPLRTQITHQACEEGWAFIAEWTGVQFSYVLNLVGVSPQANFVVFFAFDDSWDSLDMPDAFHPQTYLAYGLNDEDLPDPHGAPLRLRVPRQLGYKSVKYLSHISLTDDVKKIGKGYGSIQPEYGYSWFAGI
jgi:DMSO/TMAO reductase YedYZ molybdopterin-dependent catalytic subunit